MTDKEVMQMALDALEAENLQQGSEFACNKAIKTLRTALAQPEPEPAAYRTDKGAKAYCSAEFARKMGWPAIPTLQREWVGLTDDEIESLDCVYLDDLGEGSEVSQLSVSMFARAIEAKLKDKNI